MPRISIFANFGYNLLHGNEYDYRFYQIMGVKAYLKENLFGDVRYPGFPVQQSTISVLEPWLFVRWETLQKEKK